MNLKNIYFIKKRHKENMKILSSIFLIISSFWSSAQTVGCTDTLAKNFQPSALINDGTCIYKTSSITPTRTVELNAKLKETSGLIYWNNLIWTHNDDTDKNLYSIDPKKGEIIQTTPLRGALNKDWEEIAQDESYIYIGDFGNNYLGNRKDLHILRVLKRTFYSDQQLVDTIHFSYENQFDYTPKKANESNFDCEAFIVSKDSIFLFTKEWTSSKTSVYAISKEPGTYSAKLKSTYNVNGLITGSVYLEEKNLVALCGYSKLLQPFIYLLYDFKQNDFFGGNKRKIDIALPFHQIEGITSANGNLFYLSNESYSKQPFIHSTNKLIEVDLSSYILPFLNRRNSKK
jgi:hypothetical protein